MQLHPSEIKIRPGLERFRKELGNIGELANSIKSKGQLQPIIINEAYELIAGGRRLAACTLYNMPVEVKIISESDSLAMRELEVEENIQRQDFTPAEYVLAVKELHELKMKLNGIPGLTRDSSWSIQDTADLIGRDRSTVSKDLELAAIVSAFPSLSDCKTKSELKMKAATIEKIFGNGDFSTETITDLSNKTELHFEIIIECSDIVEQEEIFNKINSMGLKCRVSTY